MDLQFCGILCNLCIAIKSGRLYNFLCRDFIYVKSNAPTTSHFLSDCIVIANQVLVLLLRSLVGEYPGDSLYGGGMTERRGRILRVNLRRGYIWPSRLERDRTFNVFKALICMCGKGFRLKFLKNIYIYIYISLTIVSVKRKRKWHKVSWF